MHISIVQRQHLGPARRHRTLVVARQQAPGLVQFGYEQPQDRVLGADQSLMDECRPPIASATTPGLAADIAAESAEADPEPGIDASCGVACALDELPPVLGRHRVRLLKPAVAPARPAPTGQTSGGIELAVDLVALQEAFGPWRRRRRGEQQSICRRAPLKGSRPA
ncbi:hypothetical protein TSA6c_15445 [Azospirillum sp. TSA6c]|nr:hypothetical protein TSA6c_15445 [Azospirillum sp. TSA6c]